MSKVCGLLAFTTGDDAISPAAATRAEEAVATSPTSCTAESGRAVAAQVAAAAADAQPISAERDDISESPAAAGEPFPLKSQVRLRQDNSCQHTPFLPPSTEYGLLTLQGTCACTCTCR